MNVKGEKLFLGLLAVGVMLAVVLNIPRGIFLTLLICGTAGFYGWPMWRDRHQVGGANFGGPTVHKPEPLCWPWQRWSSVVVPLMLVVLGIALHLTGAPAALLFLLCGIGAAAFLYSFMSELEKMRTLTSDKPRRGPTVRDWTLLIISVMFCSMGIFIAQSGDSRTALGTLAVFTPCALFAGYTVARKIKRQKFKATAVHAQGGARIYASNSRALLLGVIIGIPGAVLLFLPAAPLLIRGCALIMLATGLVLIYLVIAGRISRRYIRFDPEGLSLGESQYEYLLTWDNISEVMEAEYVDNPIVALNIHSLDDVLIKPETRRTQLYKSAAKNAAWMGAPVILMPQHFAVDSATLAAALLRYVHIPEARAELAPYTAVTDQR